MKLVLHPGHSKCGSTTIQKAIIKNRKALEQQGYIIPDPQLRLPGEKGFNPHGETPRPFFRRVMESNDISELKERLNTFSKKLKNSDHKILISAENLVNQLRGPAGKNIHFELREFFNDIKVIYYIRRQDDFLLSAWQQWGYKQGKNLTQFITQSLATGNPNYKVAADFFSATYGKDSLAITPIHEDYLHNGNLLKDFFNRLSINYSSFNFTEDKSNKSLNPVLCETLSRHAYLFKDIHDENIKSRLESIVGVNSAIYSRVPDFFSKEERESVLHKFESDNKYLSQKFIKNDSWYRNNHIPCNKNNQEREINKIYSLLSIQMEILIKLIGEKKQ